MLRKLSINKTKWIDGYWLSDDEVKKTLMKFDVHELDLEACLEWNQKSRIDKYDTYSFIILHFPKYDRVRKKYELNEFNIFLWKDFLLTLREYSIPNFDKIIDYYKDLKISQGKDPIKFTPVYILYEIIQSMLESMFKVIKNITLDIKELELLVFEKPSNSLVKDIMIKKRNIVVLKHMFRPQVVVLKILETTVKELYTDEIEVYFEDLEDKIEQVVNDLQILSEHIDSVEDAFKSIIDIKTNTIMTFLTLFSAFLLPLTLITSFYWMNVVLPFQNHTQFIYIFLLISIFIMLFIFLYFKKNGKI